VVIYLGHKPPNSNSLRPGSTTHIWIGGLINVDGLALMSICPRELQAMLHVCQQWSIRNHMQTQGKQKKWPSSKPLPSSAFWGVNISPAQACSPFTCTHLFQPLTLARTLSIKSPNLSTFALFLTCLADLGFFHYLRLFIPFSRFF